MNGLAAAAASPLSFLIEARTSRRAVRYHLGMLLRLATILLIVSVSAPAAASEVRLVVVLDASQAMWAPLADGRPRFVAARMALQGWVLERAADRDLAIALRVAGGSFDGGEQHPCLLSHLAIPPGALVIGDWLGRLDELSPAGPRPLLLAAADAAADLGDGEGPRRIVVVTAGEDTCFGSARPVAEAIAGGMQVRVVGVGLSDEAVERFAAVAPTRNATSTTGLLSLLRWAVEELPSSTPDEAPVRIRLTGEGLPAFESATLIHSATGERVPLKESRDQLEGEAAPGLYSLEVASGSGGDAIRLEGIDVVAGAERELDLDVPAAAQPILEAHPAQAVAGGPVLVSFREAGDGPLLVSLARPDDPLAGWTEASLVQGPEGVVELRAPDWPGPYEVRLAALDGGISRSIAHAPIESVAAEATVEAPPEIRPFEPLPVTWTGPAHEGDRLELAPAGAASAPPAACAPALSPPAPTVLTAPGDEGAFEVRYASGLSGRVLARAAVTVTRIIVSVQAPEQIAAGQSFEVAWEGPAAPADYLALSAEGSGDDEYISLALASKGSPSSLVAPTEPGAYEIRYVSGSGRVARRATVSVVPVEVQLSAPRRVRAGTRFQVHWHGPDAGGDLVAVARPQDPPDATEDWGYTSLGSPLDLAAPFEPGEYELRYVTDRGRTILASIPLTVR